MPDEKLKIDKKIDRTATSFKKVIDGNHGLKESNILALLLPIGIDNDSIDSAWLSTMNTFGTQRGVAAHTSASSYKASQPPDPKIELDTVNEVLIGLKTIDRLVNDLM